MFYVELRTCTKNACLRVRQVQGTMCEVEGAQSRCCVQCAKCRWKVPGKGGSVEVQFMSLVTMVFFSICILHFLAVFVPSRPLRFSHQYCLEEGG